MLTISKRPRSIVRLSSGVENSLTVTSGIASLLFRFLLFRSRLWLERAHVRIAQIEIFFQLRCFFQESIGYINVFFHHRAVQHRHTGLVFLQERLSLASR